VKETQQQKNAQDHKFLLPHKTAIAKFIMFTWDAGSSLKETLTVLYILGQKIGSLQSFWEHIHLNT